MKIFFNILKIIPLMLSFNAHSSNYEIRAYVDGLKYSESKENNNENDWLSYFKSNGYFSDFQNLNEWNSSKSSASLNNAIQSEIPTGAFNVSDIYSLDLSSTKLQNIGFLSGVLAINGNLDLGGSLENINDLNYLTSINSLKITAPLITNLDPLSNLTNSNNISLQQSQINNINGLYNLTKGNIYLNKNYSGNFTIDSAFCFNYGKGKINAYSNGSRIGFSKLCNSNDLWLQYLISNTGITASSMSELNNLTSNISLNKSTMTNSAIPQYPMGLNSIGSLSISNTGFTDLDFLQELNSANNITISDNRNLTTLAGLNNLESVTNFHLARNQYITDLDPLLSLKSGNIDLSNQTNITSIYGLKNFQTGKVFIYSVKYYDTFESTDPICTALLNKTVSISTSNYSYSASSFCKGDSEWLTYLAKFNKDLNTLHITDLSNLTTTLVIHNNSNFITNNSNLPPYNMGLSSMYGINITNTSFENISFMSDLKSINRLYITSNPDLTSYTGLEGLINADTIVLSNNPKTSDLNGFKSLKTINGYLDTKDLATLTDISGLANLTKGIVDLPKITYKNTFDVSSDFCTNLKLGNIKVRLNGGSVNYGVSSFCKTDSEWLPYLGLYNPSLNVYYLSELNNSLTTIILGYSNITNATIPSSDFSINTLGTLSIANTGLSNLDFLHNLKNVGYLYIRYNHSLQDLNGLVNLTTAKNIIISNSENIHELSGLSSLESVVTLDLSDLVTLTDITGLQNLKSGIVKFPADIYQNSFESDSNFCVGMNNGSIKAYKLSSTRNSSYYCK